MSTLTISPTSAAPGGKVTVTGKNFAAHAQILLSVGQTIVASTTADAHGQIRTTFVVPEGAVGQVVVRSARASSGAAKLQVLAPKPTPGNMFTYQ